MQNSTTDTHILPPLDSLKKIFKGDLDQSNDTLTSHSRDASLFEIKPALVAYPKDSEDVKAIVRFVSENKKEFPSLSITARSAGTDMSGGPLNNSIILDMNRYMTGIKKVEKEQCVVEPGCFYRDLDKETKKVGSFMPAFTASREICTVGGMVANNSGGEKAIKYGKTENYINSLKIVLEDGNEYEVKPLSKTELEAKISAGGFEGNLYKNIFDLINENYEIIMSAKPDVSKNSAGYYLWNVYDKTTGTFDICRLICGSQGTFGIITEINFKLVPLAKYSNILVVFLPSLDRVSDLVTKIVPYKPDSLETYDDYSMILAVKFFFDFFKRLGFWGAIRLGFQFIPESFMILTGGVPKLILMIEFTGETEAEVKKKLEEVRDHITDFHFKMHIAKNSAEAEKYWDIRHESFNLLRNHVHGQRTAPFIDDIVVKPEVLPEFLPKVREAIDAYKLKYTVQGHLGNGNFHIIPLMDLDSPFSGNTILELSKKVYDLVHEFKGSITAEHNDGIIRTPYLLQMYGEKIVELFGKTKKIFDPENIFNPGKKVGGTFEDITKNLIKKNN